MDGYAIGFWRSMQKTVNELLISVFSPDLKINHN